MMSHGECCDALRKYIWLIWVKIRGISQVNQASSSRYQPTSQVINLAPEEYHFHPCSLIISQLSGMAN
jgi:hypothetical protein